MASSNIGKKRLLKVAGGMPRISELRSAAGGRRGLASWRMVGEFGKAATMADLGLLWRLFLRQPPPIGTSRRVPPRVQ
ncbi:hypothetical protein IEQ34_002214 [Dendrobium chrysotoxum]|uniref:Uncharacterized protein n=1 Tax=Dendrobium chrysotoxum TaxID=161865 RepID=A0AAV7HKP8_DENCH|nr:hypothetical protein IEQ34_002214 [Dendrobium chrysotoxum]